MIILNKGKALISGSVKELLYNKALLVKIEVDNPTEAYSILSLTKFHQQQNMNGNTLELNIQKQDIPVVNKILVEKGINVISIVYKKPLEELYMNLTKSH